MSHRGWSRRRFLKEVGIGGNSPFHSMDDLLAEAQKRPILCGITTLAETGFVNVAITSSLLGIEESIEYIAGYAGSNEAALAVVRGEVDFVAQSFESVLNLIESGDFRPLLQVSAERISPHPALDGVPLLAGDEGLAVQRAAALGRDVEEAKADAEALAALVGAGRLIAAPLGLEQGLFECLEQGLFEALTDPEFEAAAAAADRSLDVARADVAQADLQAAAQKAEKFLPIVQEAIRKVRE